MNLILLSGGSGQRLWPLSNNIRSKQFIQVYKNPEGQYESMVQRVYRQIIAVDPAAKITIATNRQQVALIREQLNDKVAISVEPERRDTFPAIVLAAAFVHDRQQVGADEPVVVCPVDPFVDADYFYALKRLSDLVDAGGANLSLMGIRPDSPSEKYGYILPVGDAPVSPVKAFFEKPDTETAKGYLKQNALWNGGIFAFKLRYLLDYMQRNLGYADYDTLYAQYATLKKTSFDYAVVEHEPSIQVLRYDRPWDDLGNWSAFADSIPEPVVGTATLDDSCDGVTVVNETDIPVLCMGCRHTVVAVSQDGILVADKAHSSRIKPYVEAISQAKPAQAASVTLDRTDRAAVTKLTLMPDDSIDLPRCGGSLTFLAGTGMLSAGDSQTPVTAGDVVTLAPGVSRTFTAHTAAQLIQITCNAEP